MKVLCAAIRSRSVVQFYYAGDKSPGLRTVEPHMVAFNAMGHLALSAWYLGGAGESQEDRGWREYLLSGVASVTVLNQNFRPRQGHNPTGGKQFHSVQCAI